MIPAVERLDQQACGLALTAGRPFQPAAALSGEQVAEPDKVLDAVATDQNRPLAPTPEAALRSSRCGQTYSLSMNADRLPVVRAICSSVVRVSSNRAPDSGTFLPRTYSEHARSVHM